MSVAQSEIEFSTKKKTIIITEKLAAVLAKTIKAHKISDITLRSDRYNTKQCLLQHHTGRYSVEDFYSPNPKFQYVTSQLSTEITNKQV